MYQRPPTRQTALQKSVSTALESLEARLLCAAVTVNTRAPAQTIAGIGGNYAAGRYGAISSPNDNVGTYNLNNLSPTHTRIGIPLLNWEASNDNSDPNTFNWSGFSDSGGP